VDKVSFTGGGATAQKVMQAASATTKPLMLELGGKSANIIFPDADLDAAVPMAAQLAWW
jgi:acyl-CoA reductase-like NAD-dependent aldehyde dehydrogenase